MNLSTRDYLEVVRSYFPPPLISLAHASLIAQIAEVLPLSSNFGFECKLYEASPEADFLVAVIPSDGSLKLWADPASLSRLPDDADSSWKAIQSVLSDWSRENDLQAVHDAWLEFDVPSGYTGPPSPSFFFGFDDEHARNYPELTLQLIPRLLGRPLEESRRRKLQTCFDRLPQDALIFQVGLMLPRAKQDIRLCTRRIRPAEIPMYLERIGWPGSLERVRKLVKEIDPFVDGINADFSIGDDIDPVIGLECVVLDGPEAKAKVTAFIDHLVAEGACLREKGDAIFEWLGYATEQSDPSRWPAHLLKGSEAMGPDILSTFARTLNHIKIGFQPNGPLAAKVYLGVRHFWARRPN